MSKNVAVFVDVANIFYAAKAAGVDIDYVTLLRAATAGRDFVRAYAYTGLDPENENQRNFHAFLQRHGYRVVSKDIRKYGDGKVKANLDIELVVDMLKTARNLDIAVLVSGDGDFAPAVKAVQEMGVRVEVISFRGNTSSDLIEVADQFIDITQIAKVEKGSTRSGRRVAATAEEDLSMTEVPEKQTEGTGRGRGRSRRTRTATEVPAAAEPTVLAEAAAAPGPAVSPTGRRRRGAGAPVLTLLPGEKLSGRAAALSAVEPAGAAPEGETEVSVAAEASLTAAPVSEAPLEGDEGSSRRRRRRRRGGRGRGRGREAGETRALEELELEEEAELQPLPPPSPTRHSTFGSVWDSQIGMPSAPRTDVPIAEEDFDDLEEPEVPEYLLAERRRRAQANRPRSGRGGRAYAAAVERERFGRGGSTGGLGRYPEPERPSVHGIRGRPARPERSADRRERASAEPWSEVPPEIEAMLRAQLAARPRGGSSAGSEGGERPTREGPAEAADGGLVVAEPAEVVADAAPRRRGRRRTATAETVEASGAATVAGSASTEAQAAEPAARRRTSRRRTAAAAAGSSTSEVGAPEEAATGTARRQSRRRVTGVIPAEAPSQAATEAGAATETPSSTARRRTTRRRTAASANAAGEPGGTAEERGATTPTEG